MAGSGRRRAWWLALVTGLGTAGVVAATPPAQASTFRPRTVSDLIANINMANTNGTDDVIDLGGDTFTVTSAAVVNSVQVGTRGLPTFQGDGGHTVELRDGAIVRPASAPPFGLLAAYYADVTLTSVTLSGGDASNGQTDFSRGGALFVTGGRLALTDARLTGNRAGSGGALLLSSGIQAELTRTEVSGNTAGDIAGGIHTHSNAAVRLVESTLSDNAANAFAGGLMAGDVGSTQIIDSTVAGNRTNSGAGGIFTNGADLTIERSTFTGNQVATPSATAASAVTVAPPRSVRATTDVTVRNATFVETPAAAVPAVRVDVGGTVTFESSTASTAGAGTVLQSDSILRAGSNVFAGPCVLSAPARSMAANLTDQAACPDATLVSTAKLGLSSLADNGGPTLTQAIGPTSQAHNAGDPATCAGLATDQRGQPRTAAGRCDAGAYELQGDPVAQTNPTSPTTAVPRSATTSPPASGASTPTTPTSPTTVPPVVGGIEIDSGVLPRTGGRGRAQLAAIALSLAVAAAALRRRAAGREPMTR